jgi:hypothetical protein
MITKDTKLTTKGDCIVAVGAERSLRDLSSIFKEIAKNQDSKITFMMKVDNIEFEVIGRGDPRLTLNHSFDMVVRKSNYVCERTLMICANKVAADLPNHLVELLMDENKMIQIGLTIVM